MADRSPDLEIHLRPVLHFTPAAGWLNDPHGITFRDGRYEVFFQYLPDRTQWAPHCHWGHASGSDLLSLRELPMAIAPGDGDDGVWTGCLVVDGDEARIFYTATSVPEFGIGRVRVATPADSQWLAWDKGEVVVEAPDGLDLIAFRDPFVRREGAGWRMFVGAAGRDGTAMALSYTSTDLDTWQYSGVALARHSSERDPVWMGALWECPQIFEVDGRAVMVSSVWDADVLHYAGYALGDFVDDEFRAQAWGQLTYGDSYYAPSLFYDAAERPCVLFWMRGVRDEQAGWAGAHSVPYTLSIVDRSVVARPHPDVAAHRGAKAQDGLIEGLAADAEWSPVEAGDMRVVTGDAELVALSRTGESLTISIPGRAPTTVPVSGSVRVILDGPVLEIVSDAGLFGAAVQPQGSALVVTVTEGDLSVYPIS